MHSHTGTIPKKKSMRAAMMVTIIRVGLGGGTGWVLRALIDGGWVITTFCTAQKTRHGLAHYILTGEIIAILNVIDESLQCKRNR